MRSASPPARSPGLQDRALLRWAHGNIIELVATCLSPEREQLKAHNHWNLPQCEVLPPIEVDQDGKSAAAGEEKATWLEVGGENEIEIKASRTTSEEGDAEATRAGGREPETPGTGAGDCNELARPCCCCGGTRSRGSRISAFLACSWLDANVAGSAEDITRGRQLNGDKFAPARQRDVPCSW